MHKMRVPGTRRYYFSTKILPYELWCCWCTRNRTSIGPIFILSNRYNHNELNHSVIEYRLLV